MHRCNSMDNSYRLAIIHDATPSLAAGNTIITPATMMGNQVNLFVANLGEPFRVGPGIL